VLVVIIAVAAFEKVDIRDFGGLLTGSASASYDIEGRATITDGDTLKIGGQRIRLHGIDAPESHQSCQDVSGRDYSCGRDATRGLTSKTSGKHVSCQQRDIDRYGRIVAVCFAGDVNLNHWMVAQGWAVAYTRYSWAYLPAEVEARVAERGIWAGDFTTPEEWRRSNR
jgi:endonuclease YncB( thermonuclease family)